MPDAYKLDRHTPGPNDSFEPPCNLELPFLGSPLVGGQGVGGEIALRTLQQADEV
jgi:hypothetical protein